MPNRIFLIRLLDYIKVDDELSQFFDCNSVDELIVEINRFGGYSYLMTLVEGYKRKKWGNLFNHTAGAMPCLSLKEVQRVSRKCDEKFLVLCGWHSEEGGLEGYCAYCNVPISLHEMTVDHLVPLSVGGSEELSNCVPSCHDCNRVKSNQSAADFLLKSGMTVPEADEQLADLTERIKFRTVAGTPWQWRLSERQAERLGLAILSTYASV